MKGLTQQFSQQFMWVFSRKSAWKDLEQGIMTATNHSSLLISIRDSHNLSLNKKVASAVSSEYIMNFIKKCSHCGNFKVTFNHHQLTLLLVLGGDSQWTEQWSLWLPTTPQKHFYHELKPFQKSSNTGAFSHLSSDFLFCRHLIIQ